MDLKLVVRVAVVVLLIWVAVKVMGKAAVKRHHKNDPTQFSQASRVWIPAVCAAKADPYSQQPQAMLYR
jgi:hypothetical protein